MPGNGHVSMWLWNSAIPIWESEVAMQMVPSVPAKMQKQPLWQRPKLWSIHTDPLSITLDPLMRRRYQYHPFLVRASVLQIIPSTSASRSISASYSRGKPAYNGLAVSWIDLNFVRAAFLINSSSSCRRFISASISRREWHLGVSSCTPVYLSSG